MDKSISCSIVNTVSNQGDASMTAVKRINKARLSMVSALQLREQAGSQSVRQTDVVRAEQVPRERE